MNERQEPGEPIMNDPRSLTPRPMPDVPFPLGHLRLGYRWSRYFLWSLGHAHLRGTGDATRGLLRLGRLTLWDFLSRRQNVACNICGWQGSSFYPNVGSGYFESASNCPRCSCIDRYRSLAAILDAQTDFFAPTTAVIEVAPVRSFQAYCLWRKSAQNYRSFDLEKFAMEQGDITAMRYAEASCDYFLCFHVLEHVPADAAAVAEIRRVLKPGGQAILQVPIDHSLRDTVEYGRANPLETGHVRRYSATGFTKLLTSAGLNVQLVGVQDLFTEAAVGRFGLNREPIYLVAKPR